MFTTKKPGGRPSTRFRRAPRRMARAQRCRRRGVAIVYVALGLTVFVGAAALGVDWGLLVYRSAEAQKAADAAALAGAMGLEYDKTGQAYALTSARWYAAQNGYDNKDANVTVTGALDTAMGPGHYTVHVVRAEPLLFASILGISTKDVGARSTALYTSNAPMDIVGTGKYGANGPMNLAVFGPYAMHSNGDAYSTMYLNNGQPNPQYARDGYDFVLDVPNSYDITRGLQIDIFDPDSYNSSSGGGNRNDAMPGYRVDEIRTGQSGRSHDYTDTRYTLYWDYLNTPNIPTDDMVVAQHTYGNDSSTDMKWVTPSGFKFDYNALATARAQGPLRLRINVKSTDGSSENGFNLRAGPTYVNNEKIVTPGESVWVPGHYERDWRGRWVWVDGYWDRKPDTVTYGPDYSKNDDSWYNAFDKTGQSAAITASGRLPINFNDSGTVTVTLGEVPKDAAGGTLSITKFDTDVGAQSVVYKCSSLPGKSYTGVLSGNDEFKTDIIQLPANYTTGVWTATYKASLQDTSVWEMAYQNYSPGTPGRVKLVK